jgi:lycopene beta-cyclase
LKSHYDYIITGAGLAGLSLLMRMMQHPFFDTAQILVIDAAQKNTNDRTWCFWENEPDIFEPIVIKKWKHVSFIAPSYKSELNLSPFVYKMIRGIDLYTHVLSLAASKSNITFCTEPVLSVQTKQTGASVELKNQTLTTNKVFNSILFEPVNLLAQKASDYFLWQHFKGFEIKTASPVFNDAVATLMDFTVDQEQGTTFMYVMPTSSTTALVEYTLFTPSILEDKKYDKAITDYIQKTYGSIDYEVTHQEFGQIPMTNFSFSGGAGNIINMGVAGGQVKGSSGYAFHFIQEKTKAIIADVVAGKNPLRALDFSQKKFGLYDAVLLRVLQDKKLDGATIFTHIFSKNPPDRVFRFLNNESSLIDDLHIMASVPTRVFLPAAIKALLGVKRRRGLN